MKITDASLAIQFTKTYATLKVFKVKVLSETTYVIDVLIWCPQSTVGNTETVHSKLLTEFRCSSNHKAIKRKCCTKKKKNLNTAVTLPSSSGVSCAVCSPSLAPSQYSCTDGGASGIHTDAAEKHVSNLAREGLNSLRTRLMSTCLFNSPGSVRGHRTRGTLQSDGRPGSGCGPSESHNEGPINWKRQFPVYGHGCGLDLPNLRWKWILRKTHEGLIRDMGF